MTIGSWNGYTFTVSSKLIRGFKGLSIKGSCETKDKKKSKQKYVTRKAGQPAEISLTVQLNKLTGVTNVRSEAMDFITSSKKGTSAYFYIGKSKLISAKVMLVSATVDNVEMVGTEWIACDVKLTLKQSSKGSSSSKKKKSKKKSVKKSGTTSKKTNKNTGSSATKKVVAAVKSVAKGVIDAAKNVSKAVKTTWNNIKSAVSSAVKKATTKKTTATKKVVTTSRNCTITNTKITRLTKLPKINLNTI